MLLLTGGGWHLTSSGHAPTPVQPPCPPSPGISGSWHAPLYTCTLQVLHKPMFLFYISTPYCKMYIPLTLENFTMFFFSISRSWVSKSIFFSVRTGHSIMILDVGQIFGYLLFELDSQLFIHTRIKREKKRKIPVTNLKS